MRKTFSLGDHFERFIDAQVSDGRYDNASEVVRAALRLLEDHEARMRELRAAIAEADAEIARGEGVTVTDPQALAETVIRGARARLDRKTSSSRPALLPISTIFLTISPHPALRPRRILHAGFSIILRPLPG